ncbi:MAG TPA: ATP-dependent RNA helicase HrpA [Solirubrobacteraceae bacterium]
MSEAPVDDELTLLDEHRLKARKFDAAAYERARVRAQRRRAAVPSSISYPDELPVSARRDELLAAIRDNQVVIVAGETGSGKSTQLPKMCLELGRGVRGTIAHTQPRRLAARTIAERIADELGVPLGAAVGYAVRFNDRSGANTLLRVMTDGLLLAEITRDRLLRRYDTVIIDEAHERSLNIDFLLGYLKSILPKRPDLKVIVTSATIDVERFSAHFDGAPVVEVSGRTYPVEVRYQPLAQDADQIDAIGDAVQELQRARRSDVLVFLSGEREIRDAADALRGRLGAGTEILPLFARLSSREQHRVFRPGNGNRVVLATNVAETSLTIPGIRSVVDGGTARVSRYSARLKVQRLPIEPVSQASADQRKGRCGRTADGICIRLYSEEDFAERPRFTDPEIRRTNLASVILQMAALELGEIEAFPFIEPPDSRQIRDGVNLLGELGALTADRRLTPLGRRLARLPVDPRMGRMVLEADRLGCTEEVAVIAAALSIQDPRERPLEERAQADASHARFADENSDFLAYLNLWRYLERQADALSRSQFRKTLKSEYIHYLRVREWQDLVEQLRAAARDVDVRFHAAEAAAPRDIGIALLSGLLSHIGLRDKARGDYLGARGARFAIFPGSGLAKKSPDWIVAAELVETSRLWGRTVARIDPRWVEPLASDLVHREISEPRWDRHRAGVVATERVALYGLPIVTGRRVDYGRIDPTVSRELFIRRALVDGEWDADHDFLAQNRRRVAEVEALEERSRQRGLLASDVVLHDFFAARIPEDVVSGRHFDRWWRDARREDPDLLTYPRPLLQAGAADDAGRPSRWKQGDLELRLSYRFEPGAPDDGVTVHIPLAALGTVRDVGFDWLVPALREELVTTLIRGLPKEQRRLLVPAPEAAKAVVVALRPREGRIVDQIASQLGRLRGVRVTGDDLHTTPLPPHLRVTFSVEDDHGAVLARGHDLAEVRDRLRPQLRAELTTATAGLERTGLTDWPGHDALPELVTLPGTGGAVRGYPALVDEGETAGVRVLETPAAAAASMRAGTLRLLALTVRTRARPAADRLDNAAKLTLAGSGELDALLGDVTRATLADLLDQAGGPARDDAGWARLRSRVAEQFDGAVDGALRATADVLAAAAEARQALAGAPSDALRAARLDVAAQIGRLTHAGFVTASGLPRLPDLARYLRAATYRLGRLTDNVSADRERMTTIHELESEVQAAAPGPAREDARWLLEELRVSYFAQPLGVRGHVSAKRVRTTLKRAS